MHDFLTVGAPAPLQEAIVTGLNFGQDYYDDFLKKYTRKRDIFLDGLDEIGLKHNVPEGAYYIMVDIGEFGFDNDLEFAEELIKRVGVAGVPGSVFFNEPVNNYIRFNFSKKDETLLEAIRRLKSIREKF